MTERQELTALQAGASRILGLLLIMLSAAPAAGCVLTFTDWLPADVTRYEEYRAAERCAAGSTLRTWWQDCLRDDEVIILDTVIEQRTRNSDYRAAVKSERFKGDLHFASSGPLLETLQAGDRAVATVWRGDIVALSQGGIRQETPDEPRDEPQMTAAIGTGLGLLALLGTVFGATRFAAPRDPGVFTWSRSGKALFITNLVALFGVGLPALWLGIPWQLVTPAMVAILLAVGFFLLEEWRSAADSR